MRKVAVLGVALLLASPLHAQSSKGLTNDDRREIGELIARFAHAMDSKDADAYRRIFTDDGVFVMDGMKTWTGTKELETMVAGPRRERPKITHFFSNIKIEPTPQGAKATHYVILIDLQKNPAITSGGYCDNDVVKTRDGWKFKKRWCAVEPNPPAGTQSSSR
jgi:hypothetical protein